MLSRVSADKVFILHYFEKMFSASKRFAPRPPPGFRPWAPLETSVPRPPHCPPLDNLPRAPMNVLTLSNPIPAAQQDIWTLVFSYIPYKWWITCKYSNNRNTHYEQATINDDSIINANSSPSLWVSLIGILFLPSDSYYCTILIPILTQLRIFSHLKQFNSRLVTDNYLNIFKCYQLTC